MDIALIIGVIFGFVCMIGSIAYALFVEGSAGGFGNFLSAPSFGIVFGGMIASIFVAFPMPCLLYTSPSPRDYAASRMPSSA